VATLYGFLFILELSPHTILTGMGLITTLSWWRRQAGFNTGRETPVVVVVDSVVVVVVVVVDSVCCCCCCIC